MSTGLQQVMAHRLWFVPNVMVWGLPGLGDIDLVVAEENGAEQSILFGVSTLGEASQTISFGDLIDHRGNTLPASIAAPRVIIRPRSETGAFVIGEENDTSFRVARATSASRPAAVDLLVMETGT